MIRWYLLLLYILLISVYINECQSFRISDLINSNNVKQKSLAPPKISKPTMLHIGSNSSHELSRLIMTAEPNQPFVWCNYKEGHFCLSYLERQFFCFGASKQEERGKNQPRFKGIPLDIDSRLKKGLSVRRKLFDLPRSREAINDLADYFDAVDHEDFSFIEINGAPTPIIGHRFAAKPKAIAKQKPNPSLNKPTSTPKTKPKPKASVTSKLAAKLATKLAAKQPPNSKQSPKTTPKQAATTNDPSIDLGIKASPKTTPIDVKDHEGLVHHTFVRTDSLSVSGELNTQELKMIDSGLSQPVMQYFDHFQTHALGWSDQTRTKCGSDNYFLGGYCKYAEVKVSKTYSNLPPHSFVKLKANFIFIDRWEGHLGYAKMDNTTVWTRSHHHCPQIFAALCGGISVCGDKMVSDQINTQLEVTLPHIDNTLIIEFGTTLLDKETNNGCLASWGIDDVEVILQ